MPNECVAGLKMPATSLSLAGAPSGESPPSANALIITSLASCPSGSALMRASSASSFSLSSWAPPKSGMSATLLGRPLLDQRKQALLVYLLRAELLRLVELRSARVRADHEEVGLLRNAVRHLPARLLDRLRGALARHPRQRSRDHERPAG